MGLRPGFAITSLGLVLSGPSLVDISFPSGCEICGEMSVRPHKPPLAHRQHSLLFISFCFPRQMKLEMSSGLSDFPGGKKTQEEST